jgi:hypothetical protein
MKKFSSGDMVRVNFQGKDLHGTVCGFNNGALEVDLSPIAGRVSMFLDDGTDHSGDLHACYFTDDDTSQPVAPTPRVVDAPVGAKPGKNEEKSNA